MLSPLTGTSTWLPTCPCSVIFLLWKAINVEAQGLQEGVTGVQGLSDSCHSVLTQTKELCGWAGNGTGNFYLLVFTTRLIILIAIHDFTFLSLIDLLFDSNSELEEQCSIVKSVTLQNEAIPLLLASWSWFWDILPAPRKQGLFPQIDGS